MMVVSETRQFDDTIKKYEKDAMERVLDFFSQTSGRVDWFEDCDVLITHLRDNLSAQPFCDFLRMYLYETCQLKEQYPSCNAVPDSRYYREFTARFAANGMANIASIDPDKPHALDHRSSTGCSARNASGATWHSCWRSGWEWTMTPSGNSSPV